MNGKEIRIFSKTVPAFAAGQGFKDRVIPMLEAIRSRRRLYTEWCGARESDEGFLPLLVRQAAEHALIGEVVGESSDCPVVVGSDHHVVSHFYYEYRLVAAIYTDCIHV